MSHSHFRLSAATFLFVAALLSAAACSNQPEPARAGPAQSSALKTSPSVSEAAPAPPSAAPSQAAKAAEALAAYRGAFADWETVARSSAQNSYQSPVLADHMSGQALSSVTGQIYVNTDVDHSVSKGAPLLHPTISELVPADDPTQVVINDCVDSTDWLQYTTDGHLYNGVPGGRQKTQALVALSDGAWKVSQLLIQPVGTC